jgi:hypothetical protein
MRATPCFHGSERSTGISSHSKPRSPSELECGLVGYTRFQSVRHFLTEPRRSDPNRQYGRRQCHRGEEALPPGKDSLRFRLRPTGGWLSPAPCEAIARLCARERIQPTVRLCGSPANSLSHLFLPTALLENITMRRLPENRRWRCCHLCISAQDRESVGEDRP